MILKTADQCQQQDLILYWLWHQRTSSSFRIYLLQNLRSRFISYLIYSALSSKSEVIWEHLTILQSRYEVLLSSAWSASSCTSTHNLHDLKSKEEYIRFQTLSLTMNKEFQKWYTVTEEIHAQEHKNLLSKYSLKFQNQQAFPVTRWVRSNHDWMH